MTAIAKYPRQMQLIAAGLQVVGNALVTLWKNAINNNKDLNTSERRKAEGSATLVGGIVNGVSGALSGAASGALMGAATGAAAGPAGIAIGAVVGALPGIIEGLGGLVDWLRPETVAEMEADLKNANINAAEKRNEVTTLTGFDTKLQNLASHMYDSTEAMDAYHDEIAKLGESYSYLIDAYDAEGNAISYNEEALKSLIATRELEALTAKE